LLASLFTPAQAAPTAAAQGRIEGAAESTHASFALTGQIAEVLVREGQAVQQGQVLARLRCTDREHEARAADHALKATEDQYRRAKRGTREEERAIAAAEVQRIAALLTNARSELRRYQELRAKQLVPELDTDLRTARTRDLEEQLIQSLRKLELAKAALLPEETSRWKNEIAAARARAEALEARLSYCELRSPIRGTVLRLHGRAGEAVNEFMPSPLAELADTSRRRVRVEIDERDVEKITAGTKAELRVDRGGGGMASLGTGRVTWLSPVMGKKRVNSPDPAIARDREVREALVEFDTPPTTTQLQNLPLGLRVTVIFSRP
jgi:multidrug resistance efflux pump